MELLKLLSTSEVFAQILSFLLLFFLLRKFAWKKILKVLDDRRDRIASELKRIEDGQAEVSRIKSDYEARLATIEALANKRIQEAIAEGRKITDEVRKKAHEEAQEIINNAKANIKHELAAAKDELKDKIIDLTIAATENVIQEKLTEEDDRRLVKDFLDKLDEIE